MSDKRDYIKEELNEVQTEQKKRRIQFSKVTVILLILNIVMIEMYGIKLMEEFGDLSSLYALFAIAGTDCTAGVIWYMKNSADEKKALAQKEIQLIRLEMIKAQGKQLNPNDLEPLLNGSGDMSSMGSEIMGIDEMGGNGVG